MNTFIKVLLAILIGVVVAVSGYFAWETMNTNKALLAELNKTDNGAQEDTKVKPAPKKSAVKKADKASTSQAKTAGDKNDPKKVEEAAKAAEAKKKAEAEAAAKAAEAKKKADEARNDWDEINSRGDDQLRAEKFDEAFKTFKSLIGHEHQNHGLAYYNIACLFSVQSVSDKLKGKKKAIRKSKKQALHYLAQAWVAGYDDLEWMEKDEDLDSIRKTRGYKEIKRLAVEKGLVRLPAPATEDVAKKAKDEQKEPTPKLTGIHALRAMPIKGVADSDEASKADKDAKRIANANAKKVKGKKVRKGSRGISFLAKARAEAKRMYAKLHKDQKARRAALNRAIARLKRGYKRKSDLDKQDVDDEIAELKRKEQEQSDDEDRKAKEEAERMLADGKTQDEVKAMYDALERKQQARRAALLSKIADEQRQARQQRQDDAVDLRDEIAKLREADKKADTQSAAAAKDHVQALFDKAQAATNRANAKRARQQRQRAAAPSRPSSPPSRPASGGSSSLAHAPAAVSSCPYGGDEANCVKKTVAYLTKFGTPLADAKGSAKAKCSARCL